MAWSAAARAAALAARKNKGVSALKRTGNFSFSKGTSKPMFRGATQIGLRTVFPAGALKATLGRMKGTSSSPYRPITVVTAKGAFQASIGKKAFRGGAPKGLALNRPSIGAGFNMTKGRR